MMLLARRLETTETFTAVAVDDASAVDYKQGFLPSHTSLKRYFHVRCYSYSSKSICILFAMLGLNIWSLQLD